MPFVHKWTINVQYNYCDIHILTSLSRFFFHFCMEGKHVSVWFPQQLILFYFMIKY